MLFQKKRKTNPKIDPCYRVDLSVKYSLKKVNIRGVESNALPSFWETPDSLTIQGNPSFVSFTFGYMDYHGDWEEKDAVRMGSICLCKNSQRLRRVEFVRPESITGILKELQAVAISSTLMETDRPGEPKRWMRAFPRSYLLSRAIKKHKKGIVKALETIGIPLDKSDTL